MKFSAFGFVRVLIIAVLPNAAMPAPLMYELLIAAPNARLDERIAGLLERNLSEVALTVILPAERYRKYAHFPVAACTGSEYFLLAQDKRLIAFGCIDNASAAAAMQKIRSALTRDRETLRAVKAEALYDAALQSAAAGEWPNARRYLRSALGRGGISKDMVARLQQLLERRP